MARKNKKQQPLPLQNGITPNDGFLTVPTYLFPQSNEYSKEVVPEMKVDENKKNKNKSK